MYRSELDTDMQMALANSFVKKLFVTTGTLTLDHPQGAYVEFGTGVVGAEEPYPQDFAINLNWKYDVDSSAKLPLSRRWIFSVKDGEPNDIPDSNRTKLRDSKNTESFITGGNNGVLFMYNAIMDYSNSNVPAQLYTQALNEIIGE